MLKFIVEINFKNNENEKDEYSLLLVDKYNLQLNVHYTC
jgi:hypothetical protein